MDESIPKLIHYCWFGGGELPKLAKDCIESWKKHLPNYEIIEWNENNFDIESHPFTQKAYEEKKFAFVTDYVRLYALHKFGGIYMDTDVEVVKNLDEFLSCRSFSGFERDEIVPTGIMGSVKSNEIIKLLIDYYDNNNYIDDKGKMILIPNTHIISEILEGLGLVRNGRYQVINDNFHMYPRDYFCPIDYNTGQKFFSENTFAIHHFAGSWLPWSSKVKVKLKYVLIKIFGVNIINLVKRVKNNY